MSLISIRKYFETNKIYFEIRYCRMGNNFKRIPLKYFIKFSRFIYSLRRMELERWKGNSEIWIMEIGKP